MTTPLAQAAMRAMMIGGKYIDQNTGRPAYLGPNNEPGYAAAQAPAGALQHIMPDGRAAFYMPKVQPALPKPTLPTAAQGATALPFDGDAALQQAQLQAQRNSFESQATGLQQQIERAHGLNRRNIMDQQPKAQQGLLEDYAGRGLAYSSGYAHDQGEQQSQFAKLLAELDQERSSGLNDLMRERGAFNDSFSTQLQAIQAAAARRMAEQAGTLGLNDPAPTASVPQNNETPYVQPAPYYGSPAPAPAPAPKPAPKPAAPVKTPQQLATEKAWAAYVKFNPTNAARVAAAARKK